MVDSTDSFFRGRSYTIISLIGWTAVTLGLIWFHLGWLNDLHLSPDESNKSWADSFYHTWGQEYLFILLSGYGTLWLVGFMGIYLVSRDLKKQFREREDILLSVRKSHELLLSSEEKFSKVFQLSPAIIALTMLEDGTFLDINQKFLDISGFTRAEVIGKTSVEIGWVSLEVRDALIKEIQITGRVTNREVILHAKNGEEILCIYSGELLELGDKTYVLSLAQDITERRKAEEALQSSEAQYRLITENMKDMVWLMDMEFKPIYISPSVTKLRGFTLNELQVLPLEKNLAPDSMRRALEVMNASLAPEMIASTHSYKIELEYYKKDGSTYWSEDTFVLIRSEEGHPVGILGGGHEITEKKKAEDALRESEEILRTVFNTMEEGLALNELVYDENGEIVDYRILEVNPAYERITNVPRDQAIGKLATEFYEMPKEYINAFWKENIDNDHIVTELYEDRLKAWKHISTSRPRDGKFTTIFFDITEQKKSEEALRTSEQQYRLLFEEMMDGFALHEIICDENNIPIDYRFLAVNPVFEKLTKLKAEDVIGKTVLEVMPDIEDVWIKRYGQVALTGEPAHFENFSTTLQTHFEVRAFSPARGKFAVIFHDVTQQRNAQMIMLARMKFIESSTVQPLESLLQTILDEAEDMTGSKVGFYHFVGADEQTLLLQSWSTRTASEFCKADGKGLHYPVEKAGVWADCVREKRPMIHNDYKSLPHRKGLPEGHTELIRELVVPVLRRGKVVALLGVGNKEYNYTEQDVAIIGQLADLVWDIVESKRVEEIQKRVEQDYEALIQSIDGIVWEADVHTLEFSFVSQQAERLLGYPIERWTTEPGFWIDHIHPDDRAASISFCVAQTRLKKSHEFEYRMFTADDRIIWLRDVVSVVLENDQPVKLRGIMIDITEKKMADDRLRQLSLVVEQSPASVVITDLNGNIEYVNQKFMQVSGYTLDEVLYKNPNIVQSGKTPKETYAQLWKNITSGKVWHGEFQNKRKNGEYYWEDVLISPLLDTNGKITHFVSVKEDITERKQAENEIIEKSQELEALFKISSHLRTAQTVPEMIPVVLKQMRETFNSDANAVILINRDHTQFKYVLGDGLLAENTGLQFGVEHSISRRVMDTLEPYITLDFTSDLIGASAVKVIENIGATVVVPLQSETEFLGTLLCARAKDSQLAPFTSAEIKLLRAIGEMVGNALRRAKLYDDALSRLQRVEALRSIDMAINANMDALLTLNMLLSQTIALLKVDAAAAMLYNPASHMLEYGAGQGFHHKEIEKANQKLNRGFANTAIIERRLVTARNLKLTEDQSYRAIAIKEGFETCHIVPMIANGQVCGILEVYNKTEISPDQEWLDFLEALGGQAAIAIHSAQLFENLEKSNLELSLAYDATIEGWSKALELRDKETEGHTLRVTEWTVKLAMLAGMGEADIVQVRRGALLHDIGKMGIPDHILNKNGELTSQEWEIMRQHPQYAYNMIHPISFLRPAIEIPYYHHEKWGGGGYPFGLKGEQIPYSARLFAIIDVWDAITSNRPYRKAWSFEKALEYIKSESGRHFDPNIVELFLRMVNGFRNE